MQIRLTLAVLVVALSIPRIGAAQIHPPREGGEIPEAARTRMATDKSAFRFEHAWIQRSENARRAREAYIAQHGKYDMQELSTSQRADMAITGNFNVPVIMVKFANTGSDPYPTATLQTKLFDGPNSPRTMTQFYDEISYSNINLSGTVYGWYTLGNNDTYYEGSQNGLGGDGHVGQLLTEALNAADASVDFSQYDNDGPDGIPNSGDDDGFVDFVAFVHPEKGGECGSNSNIWSHRWILEGWGVSFTSNDARTGGGFIKVSDYTIQPALNCDGVTTIDIGVFCHEFGHAFGLPDLYDTQNSSQGIGFWGLMASGNWNTPTNPAHMSAWSKYWLGWISLVDVGPSAAYNVDNVEQNATAYRLRIPDERWRRSNTCNINGYSMHCGLTLAEATARNWASGEGYGDGWDETVSHEFTYNGGNHPVLLAFDYEYDTEFDFDFVYVTIDVGGTVSTVATYSGTGSGSANLDLTSYLNGSGASTYKVSINVQSDGGWSDTDGMNATTCGAFTFDNVTLNGGGESYSADFETNEDGWWYDTTNPTEYFLVENRQALGTDVSLTGTGLVIYHVCDDVNRSTGNTGGGAGNQPRGIMLEEADGLNQLLNGANRGDGGDTWPGLTNKTLFNNTTTPNSKGYSNTTNNVTVSVPANGDPINATMSADWPAPTVSSVIPPSASGLVTLTLNGTNFLHGANVSLNGPALVASGVPTLDASSVNWIGHALMTADFDVSGLPAGTYDVVVTNPLGGSVTVVGGLDVTSTAVAFQAFNAVARDGGVELAWLASSTNELEGFNVYRQRQDTSDYDRLNGAIVPATATSYRDETAVPGSTYRYRIGGVDADGEFFSPARQITLPGLENTLERNVPNPFNPSTTIAFTLARAGDIALDIFDPEGRVVRTLASGTWSAGRHEVRWDGTSNTGAHVTSGVYFYRLSTRGYVETRKMVLLK